MKKLYFHETRIGTFYICTNGKRIFIFYEDENLGNYTTIQQLLDDLTGGHTWSPSSGDDTSTLGIPDELSDWVRIL